VARIGAHFEGDVAEEGGLAGSGIAGDDEARMLERVFEADRLADG
jgi:hypothetical protein